MRIEHYSDRYFLDIMTLVENFHKEAVGEYDQLFDPDALIETIKTEKEANPENAFLLIVNDMCQGLLFGKQFKSMVTGKMIFQEIIWYVNPGFRRYGTKLLQEAIKILKLKGVSIIIMAVLENSKTVKIKKFYEKLGFRLMESHYMCAI